MNAQEKKISKKLGRPATGVGMGVLVRLQPDLLSTLDAWIAMQPDPKPSRPEAIRLLLSEALG
jgi:hypothetical protein